MLETFLWVLISFLSGSLPFAVWLGRLKGKDVRQVGDRNPGAINAFRAGGKWIGLAVLLLDVSKAAAPIGLAYYEFGWRGARLVPIALARCWDMPIRRFWACAAARRSPRRSGCGLA